MNIIIVYNQMNGSYRNQGTIKNISVSNGYYNHLVIS